jgi:deoxyribonuclease-4
MNIGAHIGNRAPLEAAAERGADVIQMFLSNPQSWKKPLPRDDAGDLVASGMPIYVHAPYLVNVGSPNNRVRIPSRKILGETLEAAAAIGARGVVVHGGHIGDEEEPEVGFERWAKALDAVEPAVPVLIENTAGGGNAVLRDIDNYGPLWEVMPCRRPGTSIWCIATTPGILTTAAATAMPISERGRSRQTFWWRLCVTPEPR